MNSITISQVIARRYDSQHVCTWYFKNTCIYNINNMKPFYLFLLKFSKISFHFLEANEAKFSNLPKISEICYIKIKAGKRKITCELGELVSP